MVQLPSLTISSRASRSHVPSDHAGEVMSLLTIKGNQPEENDERKPIDLCVVLDKSGSMRGEKLQQCKDTLKFLVTSALTERDRLALVSFDSDVNVDFPLTHLTEDGKSQCLKAMQKINCGSNTNLSGGLFQGLQLLLEQHEWAERCGVCLLTDGQLNEGITDPQKLLAMLGTTLEKFTATTTTATATMKRAPPSVMCFGYGSDASTDILTSIASKSGGNYYSILSTEAVPLAFSDALGGLLALVAQNISVKVTVQDAISLTPLTQFEFIEETPTSFIVNLKDMYAGESRDVLFKVKFSAATDATARPIKIAFQVRYVDVVTEETAGKAECECIVNRVPLSSIPIEANKDDLEVARHQIRWDATVALKEARRVADTGDLHTGSNTMGKALEVVQARMADLCITEEDDDMMAEINTDLRTASLGMQSQTMYGQSRGKIAAAEYSHSHQRSNKTEEFLQVKSSPFMARAAMASPPSSAQSQQQSSTYSVPSKRGMVSATKSAFNLT